VADPAPDETGPQPNFPLLPFSYIVGQDELRRMLLVAYVMGSSVGGVLVSGERGTAKSTSVRSFSQMMYGSVPTTLPINATDDRVVGGWDIDSLMRGRPEPKRGLLQEANKTGFLYIDEVNLLDDHIVNLILDVVSTGVLVVQRDGIDDIVLDVSFMLIGTMNPDEGALRPQLLDRFGLFVAVQPEERVEDRARILRTVLRFDLERERIRSTWLDKGREDDRRLRQRIIDARERLPYVRMADEAVDLCARVAAEFAVVGHRAEIVMARAAMAVAALAGRHEANPGDVKAIARAAIIHRRRDVAYLDTYEWSDKDRESLNALIPGPDTYERSGQDRDRLNGLIPGE
jgi:magnesium chelatase subunit I